MSEPLKFPTDLSKLIELLRKKGVKSFEYQGLKLELNDEAPQSNYKKKQQEPQQDYIPTEGMPQWDTDAALFWSSEGLPDLTQDPNQKDS
jgi:hypothetical protein